uniref:hypothetical protein n=1 Tax=Agarivorans sp. TaxID=1872412 RepID=UPI003D00D549
KESESINPDTGEIKWKEMRKFNADAKKHFERAKVSEIVELADGRYGYPDPENPDRMFIYSHYMR